MKIQISAKDSLELYSAIHNSPDKIKSLSQEERRIVSVALNNIDHHSIDNVSNTDINPIIKKLSSKNVTPLSTKSTPDASAPTNQTSKLTPSNTSFFEKIGAINNRLMEKIEKVMGSFLKEVANKLGLRISSYDLGKNVSKITPQSIQTFKEKSIKEAEAQLSKADAALLYIQKQKLTNLAGLNEHHASSIREFMDRNRNKFMHPDGDSSLDFLDQFVRNSETNSQKNIESITSSVGILKYAKTTFDQCKLLRNNLMHTYNNMPPSTEKETFRGYIVAFTEAVNKQQGIFKTPSTDTYLNILEAKKLEALQQVNALTKVYPPLSGTWF